MKSENPCAAQELMGQHRIIRVFFAVSQTGRDIGGWKMKELMDFVRELSFVRVGGSP